MIITPHLLAGSAVADATTDNLAIAFFIGFFLHFLLDAIPHVDPGTFYNPERGGNKPWPTWLYIYAVSEFIVIWTIVIILFKNRPDFGIIMMGGLGGIFIDIVDNNPFRMMRTWPVFRQIHAIHTKLHYDLPAKKWYWGVLTQIIIIGASLWLLYSRF